VERHCASPSRTRGTPMAMYIGLGTLVVIIILVVLLT
jgi:hypothetical protein